MTQKQLPVRKEGKKNGRPGAERPEEDAGKKSVAVTIVRILLFIVIVCMSLFFYAIRTGRIDVQLIRYAEKDLSPARRNVDPLDEHFDRKSESAITNASELIALGQRCSRINDVGDAQAAVYFRKAAELGSPVGQYLLAGMYDEGRGVLQNREKALALYLQAAEQGYGEAQNKLGEMYEKGDGVAQDMAQAAVWYRKAAELRSDNAQMKLGLLLITGQGVPRDTEQGLDLLQQLVERNNKDAMFALACLYDTGDGVEQDKKKALDWLRQAVDKGNAAARYTLGMLYYHGDGLARDIHKAARLIQTAAAYGDANARQAMRQDDLSKAWQEVLKAEQDALREEFIRRADQTGAAAWYELGKAYEEGDQGLLQDKAQAADWYRKAAEQKNTDAMFALARMYDTGDGLPQDKKKALDLYLKVADSYSSAAADAMLALWRMYDTGDGVEQDKKKALDWLLRAAKDSHVEAMRRLGLLYAEGSDLVERDGVLAALLYSKASEKGDGEASFLLACQLDAGNGKSQNNAKALVLYHKAAQLNYPPAAYRLGKIYSRGEGVDPDLEQAAFWFQRAAEQGNADAQYALGQLYADGYGVPRDLHEAARWYRKAAELGNEDARMALQREDIRKAHEENVTAR